MRIVMFYHSLVSDWNHGNAHFLRGVVTEFLARGHDVQVYEPRDGWSRQHLLAEHGTAPIEGFHQAYPNLHSILYDPARLDLDQALAGAQLVLVHEWNDHALVRAIGEHHARTPHTYRLLFHDTHHRAVTDQKSMAAYDLRHYDGVLAFGGVIADLYLAKGWTKRAWTWHEAADTRIFHPRMKMEGERRKDKDFKFEISDLKSGKGNLHTGLSSFIPYPSSFDLVWIGNWGDEERTRELNEFLIEPVKALKLKARVYGVRYPKQALAQLKRAGIEYAGWLPNYEVPNVFARFKATVHVPRRPYVEALPGIPTIRPFEALACGIPLISAPWDDREQLFTIGKDFLMARSGAEMTSHLKTLLADDNLRRELAQHGLRTIKERHTCAHRVDQLLSIYDELESHTPASALMA